MERYPVKKNDSLWSIARQFGVSVDAIAKANGLKGRQVHLIKIDQILLIPERTRTSPATKLDLRFRGIDFSTVTPQKVKVEHDGGIMDMTLDASQCLKLGIYDNAQGLKVWIQTPDKQLEEVFNAECVPLGTWALSIDSRMVKTDGQLQAKRGQTVDSTPGVKEAVTNNAKIGNGKMAKQETRVEAGAPTQGIATVFTGENLRLSPSNEKYRNLIVAAAKKYGLTPQSLAAMIDAEAAKHEKTGEWMEESNKGKPKKAQGLAQFLEAGWSAVYDYEKSLLHSDTKSMSLSARLAKRLVAKYAIDSAAAYAIINTESFEKQTGLAAAGLPPEDIAKLAYFLHHEGVLGARRVFGLADKLTQAQWRQRLAGQLGNDEAVVAKVLRQYNENAELAYKGWLFGYIDAKINVNHFVVTDGKGFQEKPRSMSEIVSSLKAAGAAPKPAKSAAPKSEAKTGIKPTPQPATKPSTPPAAKPAAKATPEPAPKSTAKSATEPSPANVTAQSQPTSAPTPAATESSIGNSEAKWHDPLAVCTLRTEGLGPTGARFGWTRKQGTKNHQGIDLVAVPGTPIYAVANGRIYRKPAPSTTYAYGDTLILEVGINDLPPAQAEIFRKINPNKQTIGFFYAHLSELPDKNLKHVNAGDIIGKTGESGNAKGMNTVAKGAHLHFEVRIEPFKTTTGLSNRADPLPFINNCTNR